MWSPILRPEVQSRYLSYTCSNDPGQLPLFQDEEVVFLDFEATGVDPNNDEIIEVGALRVKGTEIIEKFNTLVKPSIFIPAYIVYATNINDEMVSGAPDIKYVFPKLMEFIGPRTVIAFADFELQFLKRYCRELLATGFDNKYFDVLELARIILPSLHSHRQVDIAKFFNIPVTAAHRAYDDVEVLCHLYRILLAGVLDLDRETLRQISSLSVGTEWPLRELFGLAERTSPQKTNKSEVSTRQTRRAGVAKPAERSISGEAGEELEPLNGEKLLELFAEKGLLASQFDAYETRKEQLEMVLNCAEAFNERKHLVIEAGTGTGKSLAYLVPSIYFAVENDLRVIISTKSINLQDQLFLKDLPFLQRVLDVGFRSSILKGYSNYLCRRKFHKFIQESACLKPEQIALAAMILVWLTEVEDGDVSRLNIHSDYGLWPAVCSSASSCLRSRCDWRRQNLCFYNRAKERAKRSHLVIVNHSLLFENLRLGEKILPTAGCVVVDEAHAIEDEATEQLTGELVSRDFLDWLDSLYWERGSSKTGFLLGILKRLSKKKAAPDRKKIVDIIEGLFGRVSEAQANGVDFFKAVSSLWALGSSDDVYMKREIRITPPIEAEGSWEEISLTGAELLHQMGDLQKELEALFSLLAESENDKVTDQEELMVDLSSYILKLTESIEVLESFLKGFRPEMVCWVVLAGRADLDNIHIFVAPLEVSAILAERFFSQKDTVIMTSATLTVSGSFDYLLSRVGLDRLNSSSTGKDGPAFLTVQLPSSFDFERQTKVLLASDFEDPGSEIFEKDLPGFLYDIHLATEGGVLTLFTNNRLMQQIYFEVLEPLAREGLIVFCQNVGASRQKITRDFLTDRKASLFGTASFWEGFDASGDTLRCIVITKLPFSRPNQPVVEARCQALEENGLSPFDSYLLPQAALRLKQGVGRLIRTKTDRGLIVITDSRLCRKAYASQFFSALPQCRHEIRSRDEIIKDIAKWMNVQNKKKDKRSQKQEKDKG